MYELYEARNSIYCYPNTDTLVNYLEIQDTKKLMQYETKITAAKLLLFRREGITGKLDMHHLIQIHKTLFEDLYPFAGKFRAEDIAKGSFRFAKWEYIEEQLQQLLDTLKKEKYLKDLLKEDFIKRLAYYMAELNVLHPFREGNGRTIREFTRQLALYSGYALNLSRANPKKILEASILSVIDTKKLEEIFEECLEDAQ